MKGREMIGRLIAAAAFSTVLVGGAIAQTGKPAPSQAPTVAQCTAGYKEGMPWTRQQFTEACAKTKAKEQGK